MIIIFILAYMNIEKKVTKVYTDGTEEVQNLSQNLDSRLKDLSKQYSEFKEQFINQIGKFNVGILDEIKELYLSDFGIFIEIQPDEEQKRMLEANIQMALQRDSINLEDAIDIREIKNIKLANQLLKIRRKKKQERDQQMQERNIQAQAQANAQAQQAASQAEVQKQQALIQIQTALEQTKAQLELQKLQQEVASKKELMQLEFQLNMQLKQLENQTVNDKEKYKEDRKDERTKIQASQQSELIDQRNNAKPPKNFESTSNDTMGGIDLGLFNA